MTTLNSADSAARYTVVEKLSSSGRCDVFLARMTDGEEPVVLKQLNESASADDAARFINGAKAAARLRHPSICRVLDYGDNGGRPYLVREYLAGRDLRNTIRRHIIKRLVVPEPVIWGIIDQVCDALEYAHQQLVHGRLTPQDIVLGFTGKIALLNFGAGGYWNRQAAEAAGSAVADNKAAPRYVAPEQIISKTADRRTDVFAVGLILYELLTERQVFSNGVNRELLEKLRSEPIPPPSKVNPSITTEASSIVMKAIALDPTQRYGSCAELRDAIQARSTSDQGESFTAAMLSELMQRTFPDSVRLEHTRRKQVTNTEVAVAPEKSVEVEQAPGRDEARTEEVVSAAAPAPRAQPEQRGGRGVLVLAIIGLVALGVSIWLWRRTDDRVTPDGKVDVAKLYESAKYLLASDKPYEALVKVEEARKHTKDPRMMKLLDEVHHKIEIAPKIKMARQLAGVGDYDLARKHLVDALALVPDDVVATRLLKMVEGKIRQKQEEPPPTTTAAATEAPKSAARTKPAVRRRPRVRRRRPPARDTAPRDKSTSTGVVQVTSTEPGKVFVDGRPVGSTPATVNLGAGTHTVKVVSHESPEVQHSQVIQVTAGATSKVHATLVRPAKPKPKPKLAVKPDGPDKPDKPDKPDRAVASTSETGFISVTARPPGMVYIDGKATGKLTPLWMYKVAVGSHQVEVRYSDGKSKRTHVVVKAKRVVPILLK
jgi:hypothetical protein